MSILRGESVQPSLPLFAEDSDLNGEEFEEEPLVSSLAIERRQNGLVADTEVMKISKDGLLGQRPAYRGRVNPAIVSRLITTNYLDHNELTRLWDRIVLTPKEDKVFA